MKLPITDYCLGFCSLLISYIAVQFIPCDVMVKIICFLKKKCRREMKIHEAERAWEAVRKLNFLILGRIACLELSIALVIFAIFHGLSVTWCMGVKVKPFQSHAWIEIDGKPFHEHESVELEFKKILVS